MLKIMPYFFLPLFFLLSGCGFHFRGQVPLAPPLKNLYLQTEDPYGQLARNLQASLKMSGVIFSDTPSTAKVILEIVKEDMDQQLLGVSGTQQTRQYQLTLNVTYRLTSPTGNILLAPQTVSENRTLTVQANEVLAGSNEATTVYEQMRRAIVYDIMLRLASPEVTKVFKRD